MSELLLILIGAGLVNNLVLDRMIGVCPGVALSRSIEVAFGFGIVTTTVLTVSAAVGSLVERQLLQPFDIDYLRTPVLLLAIIAVTESGARLLRHRWPPLHARYAPLLPLALVNCSALGVALLAVQSAHGVGAALFSGIGAGLGFTLAGVLFAGLRGRLADDQVPAAFRGSAILLVTLGLLALAFGGFSGFGP